MAERSYSVRLSARVDQYVAALNKAERETTGFSKKSRDNFAKVGGQMQNVGSQMTRYVTLPLVALGAGAVVAASSWESSWAGVTKTVNGTASQLRDLETDLRNMAKELPASHSEIAAVAEAAGQLGVSVEDVSAFTRTMIDLGETTNLTAQDAATSLARISNIMGTTGDDVSRMGSTIVELGNNSATTEAEIVALATRLAAAGKIAGLSEADVFAFASTLTSVGVEAEAGGTALSKVFVKIRDSVIDGNEQLDIFAQVAGTSAEDFAAAFNADPATAIASFIDGLGRMNQAGQSTTSVFKSLELTDQRLMRALLSTGEAQGLLVDQIEMGNRAWAEDTALTEEAAKRYDTFASKVQVLRNKVVDLFIDLGTQAMPVMEGLVDFAGAAIEAFAQLPGPIQAVVIGIAALAAAAGPLLIVAGSLIKNFALLKGALTAMNLASMATPIGAFTALAAAAVAVGVAVWQAGRDSAEALEWVQRNAQETADAVASLRDEMASVGDPTEVLAGRLRDLASENDVFRSAMQDTGATFTELAASMLEATAAGFDVAGATYEIRKSAEEAGASVDDVQALERVLGQLGYEADLASDVFAELEAIESTTASTTAELAEVSEDLEEQTDETAAATKRAEEAQKALLEAHEAYVDAILDDLSTMFDYESSLLNLDSSYADLTAAIHENALIQMDSKRTVEEKAEASRQLRLQEIKTAEEALAAAGIYAEQAGAIEGSAESARLQIEKLGELAEQYPELREEIRLYILKLAEIPGSVPTHIRAMLDQGAYDEVERQLEYLRRQRNATITVHTVGGVRQADHRAGVPSAENVRGGYYDRFVPATSLVEDGDPEAVLPLAKQARLRELLADPRIGRPVTQALGHLTPHSATPALSNQAAPPAGDHYEATLVNQGRDVTLDDLDRLFSRARSLAS